VRSRATGRVHKRITAIGITSYPSYIVRGDKRSVMIDSGINHLGPAYLAGLKGLFPEGGGPDYLLLTHSHYDHVGSAGYLKRKVPGLKLGAHERVAGLMTKRSALETMNCLSETHDELRRYNPAGEDVTLRPLELDLALGGGDRLDLGGLTCMVLEVPGHTRDSLAFYFPEIGVLFPGDACGVLREGGFLQVEFVASYDAYVASLERLEVFVPDLIALAHNWVLTGKDAQTFLELSLGETFRFKESAERYLDAAGGDVALAVQALVHDESEALGVKPAAGYLTNLTARLSHLEERRNAVGQTDSRDQAP
jgi:glyoxylase-like metal-dependent hydrolase (beta-lactamase superfamily II)